MLHYKLAPDEEHIGVANLYNKEAILTLLIIIMLVKGENDFTKYIH